MHKIPIKPKRFTAINHNISGTVLLTPATHRRERNSLYKRSSGKTKLHLNDFSDLNSPEVETPQNKTIIAVGEQSFVKGSLLKSL